MFNIFLENHHIWKKPAYPFVKKEAGYIPLLLGDYFDVWPVIGSLVCFLLFDRVVDFLTDFQFSLSILNSIFFFFLFSYIIFSNSSINIIKVLHEISIFLPFLGGGKYWKSLPPPPFYNISANKCRRLPRIHQHISSHGYQIYKRYVLLKYAQIWNKQ